ncbi:MAG TPA: hypothetical protein VFP54_04995 [Acidimicrobiales bacterium]|nr:hypothetical protein [Acidimicrobiales bacterium]
MINLVYVGGPIVVCVVGYLLIALRNRRPTSVEAGVEAFARELRALDPGRPSHRRRRRERTHG